MTRALTGLLLALLAVPAVAQSARKFNVAVVRADGVVIPFAQFDNGTWRPFWTGVERGNTVSVPITLDVIDEDWWRGETPSLEWRLMRPDGPVTVRATTPRSVYTPCSTQVGLATDYKPSGPLPPPHEAPFPKLGLATTGAVEIEPIRAVPPNDTDWLRVRRALGYREFRNAENQALADMAWSHPVRSSERDRGDIDLQAVWHVKDSRFFYFEAMRRYPDPNPPKGQPPCELVTYVAGYLWEDRSEELRPVGVRALISYCHMERASFFWPLGVIRDGAKQFWLFQSAGWTGEVYGVAELDPSRGRIVPHLYHLAGRCE